MREPRHGHEHEAEHHQEVEHVVGSVRYGFGDHIDSRVDGHVGDHSSNGHQHKNICDQPQDLLLENNTLDQTHRRDIGVDGVFDILRGIRRGSVRDLQEPLHEHQNSVGNLVSGGVPPDQQIATEGNERKCEDDVGLQHYSALLRLHQVANHPKKTAKHDDDERDHQRLPSSPPRALVQNAICEDILKRLNAPRVLNVKIQLDH
mmetsp:Transcript_96669/g.279061  ORF Transcript_96669/g.279061 Transcript_96669/m.279061 type:complete len:204 (+) Transcript_96669:329-940(+)